MLRRVTGGHREEITILEYDHHLSLVATGCIDGEITVYDFELSRVEGLLIGHTGDITALTFLAPLPILVSASMDNTVCLWGVRGAPSKLMNICFRRFENISWKEDKEQPAVVTRLEVWRDRMKGIRMHRKLTDRTLPSDAYRKFDHNFVFALETVE